MVGLFEVEKPRNPQEFLDSLLRKAEPAEFIGELNDMALYEAILIYFNVVTNRYAETITSEDLRHITKVIIPQIKDTLARESLVNAVKRVQNIV